MPFEWTRAPGGRWARGDGGFEDAVEDGADGVGEFDVDGAAAGLIEEGAGAAGGLVDDLIDEDEVARGDLFAEAAHGARSDDPLTANRP